MEAAKCRLCGERHYGLCKQYQDVLQEPLKRVKDMAVARVSGLLPSGQVQKGSDLCTCACCQRWRAKKAEQMKRYRAKRVKK